MSESEAYLQEQLEAMELGASNSPEALRKLLGDEEYEALVREGAAAQFEDAPEPREAPAAPDAPAEGPAEVKSEH